MTKSPLDITNTVKLWLDASDLSAVPNPWIDKSGNGNSPSKNGNPAVVPNGQNSRSILRFDSLNQEYYRKSNSNIKNGDQTWMVLMKPLGAGSATNHSSGGILTWRLDANNYWTYEANDANRGFKGRIRHKSGRSFRLTSATPASTSSWTLFEISFDRSNNKFYSWRNGTVLDNGINHTYSLGDDGEFRILRAANSRNVAGDLAEVISYQSVSSDIREKMEGYLSHKWGLTSNLPSGHAWKNSAPAFTSWSDVQSFTTPNTISPTCSRCPVGGQFRHHLSGPGSRTYRQWK